MFERVRARKTEKGVAVFMRAYGTEGTKKMKKKTLNTAELTAMLPPLKGSKNFAHCQDEGTSTLNHTCRCLQNPKPKSSKRKQIITPNMSSKRSVLPNLGSKAVKRRGIVRVILQFLHTSVRYFVKTSAGSSCNSTLSFKETTLNSSWPWANEHNSVIFFKKKTPYINKQQTTKTRPPNRQAKYNITTSNYLTC
jgi:hypothetical protein